MARVSEKAATPSARERTPKKVTYTPPDQFEIPDEVRARFKRDGYALRWVRVLIDGQEDLQNIAKRMKEHYTFVPKAEAPEIMNLDNRILKVGRDDLSELIIIGDLALAKQPSAWAQARRDYYDQKARNQEEGINNQLRQDVKNTKLDDESRTNVYKGRRPAHFASDENEED
jgi:hypothetical protein